jgi:hypothetical protein
MLLGFAVLVIDAKEQGTSLPKIKCHYRIFKRSNSLTYRVLISWALFLIPVDFYIFWWGLIMCPNGSRLSPLKLIIIKL